MPSHSSSRLERGEPIRALQDTITSLGAPIWLHTVEDVSAPVAAIARWRHHDAVVNVSPSDTIRLTFSLKGGQRIRGYAGRDVAADQVHMGSISMFPSSEHTKVTVEGEADILQLFLLDSFPETLLGGQFICPPLFDSHDQKLQAAAMQLLVGAVRGEPDDMLILETGLHALTSRLMLYADGDPNGYEAERRSARDRLLARGGLSASARRRVNEMIVAALDDSSTPSPTLAHLAGAANLSVSHFLRAFQRQTGETPHRHVLRRRLERAIALLKRPGKSVAEVADDTGFATPAHFVATFRRTMGVTPGAVRDALVG